MDKWVSSRLSECLGFEVPDEMIGFVLTLKEPHDVDEYFGSLLDFSVAEHRLFLNDFKQRVFNKNKPNGSSGTNSKAGKKNPLDVKQPNKKTKYEKQKTPPISQGSNQDSNKPERPSESQSATSTTSKKKTNYVNLYSQDGEIRDIVLLKGRHMCTCQASKHKLINNCIQCGRIVCEQEGSGPCLFCGNLVCSEEETKLIESASKKGENLKKSLMQQHRPKGWEEALAMRNRLLEYDRTSERRTTVIDDESDYFATNSVWLSDTERKKLKQLEDELNEKKHASRLTKRIAYDFAGREVVEEPQLTMEFEDDILKKIANTFVSTSASMNDKNSYKSSNAQASGDCHPLLSDPAPVFINSVQRVRNTGEGSERLYDGVYNRVQDKELLEVSDMRSCMSMHQPWASLLVAGIKKHEGRAWYTSHRGRLWIAATAKPVDMDSVKLMQDFYKKHYKDEELVFPTQYPSGCLLGCVLVQDCLPQEEYRKIHPNGESDSPYVFVCTNPQELPIRFPVKGAHKIYKLDESIHTAAVKALQRISKLKAEE